MVDGFKNEYENIRKLITGINQDVGKRQQNKKEGKQTALIDSDIRSQFNSLEKQLELFNNQITEYQKTPTAYGITQKEAERRKNLYNELLNQKQQAKAKYEQQNDDFMKGLQQTGATHEKSEKFEKKYDEDGTATNKQLYQAQQQEKKLQDQQLDVLIDTIGNVKHIGKAIGHELDEQDELLDELDHGIDKNINSLEKTRGKMSKLMEETSKCCLITTIIVEIASLVLMLIFLK